MMARIVIGSKSVASQNSMSGVCDFDGIAVEHFDEGSQVIEVDVAAVGKIIHVL